MTIAPWFAVAVLLLTNLVAFAAQGLDKLLAQRQKRRISEGTLLLLGVPLAAPGMWLGMKLFRHKTTKWSFLALAVVVTVINVSIFSALVWASQRGWLTIGAID